MLKIVGFLYAYIINQKEDVYMFEKMRRSERKLTEDETKDILATGEYGVISTVGEDGYPYGVPVNYVYTNGKIYFHCAIGAGHKLDNIKNCDKVCFTVVGKTELLPEQFSTKYESVIAFGTAKEVVTEKQQVLEKLIEKYAPEYIEPGAQYISSAIDKTGIIEIEIENITGKARK